MSYLHVLKPKASSRTKRKRVGRGPGSNLGKTSGRGHKGQKQHGKAPRPGFEGGQMPIIRVMPKRGFTAKSRPRYQVLNLDDLNQLEKVSEVTINVLRERNLIKRNMPVKILGQGELKKGLTVEANAFSKSALAKIKKAGGSCRTSDLTK